MISDIWKKQVEVEKIEKAFKTFSPEQYAKFNLEYKKNKKSLIFTYLCCVLGGLHYIYLRDYKKFILFQITMGGFLVWWAWDLGMLYFIVEKYNRREAFKIIESIGISDLNPV